MELVSLYLFTLLGGIAVGACVCEKCFLRKRSGEKPWLIPAVVVVLFVVGTIAATTHIQSIPRAFDAVFAGTINMGSGMVMEVLIAIVFLVLAIVDLIVTLVKKDSPYALRVIAAFVGVICMFAMGLAYTGVYGIEAWCNAPATVISFVAGDLAMGFGLCMALGVVDFGEKTILRAFYVFAALLAIGLCLEVVAFVGVGADSMLHIVAFVVAPVLAAILAALSAKKENKKAYALAICIALIVGVAISRYAFYAVATVL